MRLVQLWSDGHLELLPQSLLQDQVLVVLIEILNRTLFTQHTDGSWGLQDSSEEIAYSILTLVALQDLPHARPLASKIHSAIQAGRQVLVQTERQWKKPRCLWTGKVTYGCSFLAETYCLAAMNAPFSRRIWSDKMEKTDPTTNIDIMSLSRFLCRLSECSHIPGWKILASVLEGSLYLQQLKVSWQDIFPDQLLRNEYLAFIPSTWIIVNNCTGKFLNSTLIWDMMVMSMVIYTVDEYMESVVSELQESDRLLLQQTVRALCRKPDVAPHLR